MATSRIGLAGAAAVLAGAAVVLVQSGAMGERSANASEGAGRADTGATPRVIWIEGGGGGPAPGVHPAATLARGHAPGWVCRRSAPEAGLAAFGLSMGRPAKHCVPAAGR